MSFAASLVLLLAGELIVCLVITFACDLYDRSELAVAVRLRRRAARVSRAMQREATASGTRRRAQR